MIKITRFFYINLLVIPLFVLAYFVGALQTLLMAYAVVTVHELFHLFAALLLKVRVGSIYRHAVRNDAPAAGEHH